MKKLKLDMDALEVETFDVRSVEADEDGTVFGQHVSTRETCSYSVEMMCFAQPETITMDVYDGECNTMECPAGSGLAMLGCNTAIPCG